MARTSSSLDTTALVAHASTASPALVRRSARFAATSQRGPPDASGPNSAPTDAEIGANSSTNTLPVLVLEITYSD